MPQSAKDLMPKLPEATPDYEPIPIRCVRCDGVVGFIVSGWAREGQKARDGQPEATGEWRKPVQSDFNEPYCEACEARPWYSQEVEKLFTTPTDGFVEFDSLAFADSIE